MKIKKSYLMVFILILYFSLALQQNNTIFNEIDAKNNRSILTYPSTSNSHIYEWNRTWGGSSWDYDGGVAVDSLGNIYLTGYTRSFGAGYYDMVLVQYDNLGNQLWNVTWGGIDYDAGWDIAVDSSDNVYVTGSTESYGAGLDDMILVKYNNFGVQQWNHTWGGGYNDRGYGIAVDSSDNVYVTGSTQSFGPGSDSLFLVKYNSSGVLQWQRTWGGSNYDFGIGVAVDSSDNIYVVGETENYGAGAYDLVLVKYDTSGVHQWYRTWGEIFDDNGVGVTVDSLDNIYVSGSTQNYGAGSSDFVLVKYDNSGVQKWYQTWGGFSWDYGGRVAVDSFDNIYIGGQTQSFAVGNLDIALVKYDSNGVQQWNYTWGGVDEELGASVALDPSDNVYASGKTSSFGAGFSDMILLKYGKIPDIEDPIIIIDSPAPDEKFADNAPDYDISIIEPNLASFWYTIDGGVTNYTITQFTGTINQTAWDAAPYGSITIGFYAEDLSGNIGYSEVAIEKVEELDEKEEEPAIPGYNLLIIISVIGILTVIYMKKK